MTYDDYILIHKTEREEADRCDLCKYEDREPWEEPCTMCKRNWIDLYERDTGKYGERVSDERNIDSIFNYRRFGNSILHIVGRIQQRMEQRIFRRKI